MVKIIITQENISSCGLDDSAQWKNQALLFQQISINFGPVLLMCGYKAHILSAYF